MSGSVLDALTDPRVSALLGLTQGFAQAAMPSRMPVPLGAAIGMGAGGALQGLRTGQQLQMGSQQLEQAQIANQRAKMLLDWYRQSYGGAPTGAAAPGAVGGPEGVQAPVSGNGYLVSPQKLAGLADLAMATGNDRTAATLYGLPNTMAGGAGYAMGANGAAFPTPGGAADPRIVAQKAGAEAWAKVNPGIAQAAGEAAAKAPFEPPVMYQAKGADGQFHTYTVPRGTPLVSGGMTPAAYAELVAGKENATGNPAATNPRSTAKGDGQFINQTWLEQFKAAYPQQAQGMTDDQILALRSNPTLSRTMIADLAAINAPQISAAGFQPNAANLALAHRFGAAGAVSILNAPAGAPLAKVLPPQVLAANPDLANMTVGQVVGNSIMRFGTSPVVFGGGAEGPPVLTPQQQAALDVQTSNQKALGEAEASRTRLITTRSGVYDPVAGKEVYRQPEYHELQDPGTGAEYPAFVQPQEDGQLKVMGGPPGQSSLPPTKIAPGVEDSIKHLADEYANEDKQKYEGAISSLYQLGQQDRNMQALNSGDGWSATGAGANARMEWAKAINSIAATLHVKPLFDPSKVSSWEDATKIQTQLAFAQAKQLGSREAQQVISMSRAATPGAENTEAGYRAISGGYHEMNNREVDLYNYKTQWLQTHGGNLTGAETAFNQQFTPKMYADRAISVVHPPEITANSLQDAEKQFQKYLPGTVIKLNGQLKMVPNRPGVPQAPPYLDQYRQGADGGGS